MKVRTLGDRNNPVIVMIPGMFCTSEMPGFIADYLKEDYYCILPTLDGHHKEEPVYHSKTDDVKEIISWLHENNIEHIALLQGTSMGAEIALELARQCDIPIDNYLFDGGPFFLLPRICRVYMANRFMKILNIAKGKEKEEAFEGLKKDSFVRRLGGESLDSYFNLMGGYCEVSQWMDKDSVIRLTETCLNCVLYDLPKEVIRKSTFIYSKNEPPRMTELRLKRKYSDARFIVLKGYGHAGFQGEEPGKYAAFVEGLLVGA